MLDIEEAEEGLMKLDALRTMVVREAPEVMVKSKRTELAVIVQADIVTDVVD